MHVSKIVLWNNMVRTILNFAKIAHKHVQHANHQHYVQFVRVKPQWQSTKCVIKTVTLHTNIITTIHVSNYVPMAHTWHTQMSIAALVQVTAQHAKTLPHDAYHARASTCSITHVWWNVHRIILVIKISSVNYAQTRQITQRVCCHWTLVPKWR